jgi:hypothetical protein
MEEIRVDFLGNEQRSRHNATTLQSEGIHYCRAARNLTVGVPTVTHELLEAAVA